MAPEWRRIHPRFRRLGPHAVYRRTRAPDNSVLVSHYNTRHGSETDFSLSSHQGDTLRSRPTVLVPLSALFSGMPLWGIEKKFAPSLFNVISRSAPFYLRSVPRARALCTTLVCLLCSPYLPILLSLSRLLFSTDTKVLARDCRRIRI